MKTLGLNDKLSMIQFNLESQLHLIMLLPNGDYFLYLALDSSKANIALTKALVKKYKSDIESNL